MSYLRYCTCTYSELSSTVNYFYYGGEPCQRGVGRWEGGLVSRSDEGMMGWEVWVDPGVGFRVSALVVFCIRMIPGFPEEGGGSDGDEGMTLEEAGRAVAVTEVFSMYLSNIPQSCTEIYLKRIFEAIGSFYEWKGVTDPLTGKCGSFGLVSFSNGAACQRAVKTLGSLVLGGKKLSVKLDPLTEGRLKALFESGVQLEAAVGNNETEATGPSEDDLFKERLAAVLAEQPSALARSQQTSHAWKGKEGGQLNSEVEKWKVQYSQAERLKWIQLCVEEYFGNVDDDLVAYLSKMTPVDFEPKSSHYQELQLLFVQDLNSFLGRLNKKNN